ncbi:hypothetical protein B0H14DRAFT_2557098 [Mycena olivaceomarginata]|nr:hypothetical protein B0H14DRAFT_2557098 [Mycena olivaceomarginata]
MQKAILESRIQFTTLLKVISEEWDETVNNSGMNRARVLLHVSRQAYTAKVPSGHLQMRSSARNQQTRQLSPAAIQVEFPAGKQLNTQLGVGFSLQRHFALQTGLKFNPISSESKAALEFMKKGFGWPYDQTVVDEQLEILGKKLEVYEVILSKQRYVAGDLYPCGLVPHPVCASHRLGEQYPDAETQHRGFFGEMSWLKHEVLLEMRKMDVLQARWRKDSDKSESIIELRSINNVIDGWLVDATSLSLLLSPISPSPTPPRHSAQPFISDAITPTSAFSKTFRALCPIHKTSSRLSLAIPSRAEALKSSQVSFSLPSIPLKCPPPQASHGKPASKPQAPQARPHHFTRDPTRHMHGDRVCTSSSMPPAGLCLLLPHVHLHIVRHLQGFYGLRFRHSSLHYIFIHFFGLNSTIKMGVTAGSVLILVAPILSHSRTQADLPAGFQESWVHAGPIYSVDQYPADGRPGTSWSSHMVHMTVPAAGYVTNRWQCSGRIKNVGTLVECVIAGATAMT